MWLKIKVWTKVVIAAALAIYALFFVYNNTGKQVDFWWWFGRPTSASVFTLSFLAFMSGVIAMVLASTTWKTIRQVRELRTRARTERMERELADMKTKAAMLQTRHSKPGSAAPPPQEMPE